MKTINEIKEDLSNIKYYYSRKKKFDVNFGNTGINDVFQLTEKYNLLAKKLKSRLYDIYIGLYVNNHTQQSLANELGSSQSYVFQQNKILVDYFYKKLNNEEKAS